MHCPSCGAEAELTQKFCRSCGFSLEKVPQLVVEQVSSPEILLETKKLQKRQQLIDQSLLVAGVGFIAAIVTAMVCGIIYLMAVGSMPIVPGIVLLILISIGVVAGSLATYSERLKKSLSQADPLKPEALVAKESDLSLSDRGGPLFSVTERTTNLLEPSHDAGRNQRKEGDA